MRFSSEPLLVRPELRHVLPQRVESHRSFRPKQHILFSRRRQKCSPKDWSSLQGTHHLLTRVALRNYNRIRGKERDVTLKLLKLVESYVHVSHNSSYTGTPFLKIVLPFLLPLSLRQRLRGSGRTPSSQRFWSRCNHRTPHDRSTCSDDVCGTPNVCWTQNTKHQEGMTMDKRHVLERKCIPAIAHARAQVFALVKHNSITWQSS